MEKNSIRRTLEVSGYKDGHRIIVQQPLLANAIDAGRAMRQSGTRSVSVRLTGHR